MTDNEKNISERLIYKTNTTDCPDEPELKNAKTLKWEYMTNQDTTKRKNI